LAFFPRSSCCFTENFAGFHLGDFSDIYAGDDKGGLATVDLLIAASRVTDDESVCCAGIGITDKIDVMSCLKQEHQISLAMLLRLLRAGATLDVDDINPSIIKNAELRDVVVEWCASYRTSQENADKESKSLLQIDATNYQVIK
jgi:hypothetical protein